jgi:hypothetical protein
MSTHYHLQVDKTFKGLTWLSWLRLLLLPVGLTIYVMAIVRSEPDSSQAYYLFSNLFAIPFSLFVVAFWESFDNARIWAKFLIGVQPLLWILFFWV